MTHRRTQIAWIFVGLALHQLVRMAWFGAVGRPGKLVECAPPKPKETLWLGYEDEDGELQPLGVMPGVN